MLRLRLLLFVGVCGSESFKEFVIFVVVSCDCCELLVFLKVKIASA